MFGLSTGANVDPGCPGCPPGLRALRLLSSGDKTLWDILLPFSDYAFNRTHRWLRPGVLLDRLSESQLSI